MDGTGKDKERGERKEGQRKEAGKAAKSNDLSIFTMIPEKLIFIPRSLDVLLRCHTRQNDHETEEGRTDESPRIMSGLSRRSGRKKKNEIHSRWCGVATNRRAMTGINRVSWYSVCAAGCYYCWSVDLDVLYQDSDSQQKQKQQQ